MKGEVKGVRFYPVVACIQGFIQEKYQNNGCLLQRVCVCGNSEMW